MTSLLLLVHLHGLYSELLFFPLLVHLIVFMLMHIFTRHKHVTHLLLATEIIRVLEVLEV